MIFKFLEKIREKNESQRRIYAFIISGSVTIVIFVFWILAKMTLLGPVDKAYFSASEKIITPFQSVSKDVATVFVSVKNVVKNFRSKEYVAPKEVYNGVGNEVIKDGE